MEKFLITYFPSFRKFRKGPWGGSRMGVRRSAEHFIVATHKCPICGKTNDELTEEFKRQGMV